MQDEDDCPLDDETGRGLLSHVSRFAAILLGSAALLCFAWFGRQEGAPVTTAAAEVAL